MEAGAKASVELLSFERISDLISYIDSEAKECRKKISSYSKMLNEAQDMIELEQTINEIINTVSVEKEDLGEELEGLDRFRVNGINVVFEPSPGYEYKILREAIASYQRRLSSLENLRRFLEPFLRADYDQMKILLVIVNGRVSDVIMRV